MAIGLAMSAALVPTVANAGPPPSEDLGFVLEATGKWQIAADGGAPQALVAGQAIKAGHQVTASASDAHLTIVLLDGDRLVCPKDPRCAAPLGGKQKESEKPGLTRRLVRAVAGLFSTPERYATTMSRGEELKESVLRLRGDKLDLADLFSSLPEGDYALVLEPIEKGAAPDRDAAVKVAAAWNPKKPRPVVAAGLKPGLYRAALESGADAWVLVPDDKEFTPQSKTFAALKKLVAGWTDVPARSTRSMLRAGLERLAFGETENPETK
jgi:hypothetical protein